MKKNGNIGRITCVCSEELEERVKKEAKKEARSKSNMALILIQEALERRSQYRIVGQADFAVSEK